MRIPWKKSMVLLLIVMIFFPMLSTGGVGIKGVKASNSGCSTLGIQSTTINTLNPICGIISSGNNASLVTKNQGYLAINSGTSDSYQEASFWTECFLESDNLHVKSIEINFTIKASIPDSIHEIYLYNYSTSTYDLLLSSEVNTWDTDIIYSDENADNIARYVSNANGLKIKTTIINDAAFVSYFDYLNVVYEYQPQTSNRLISTYNINNVNLEQGIISENNATYLEDRDGIYFNVDSSSNKVAWNSSITLDQQRNKIKSLIISYSGKYSTDCNNTWVSLWNYETGNWEAIDNFISNTNTKTNRWITSDPIYINKFISTYNDVKVRVYNSSSVPFTRNSDWLNVTVCYDTSNFTEICFPDDLEVEYGIIENGDHTSLAAFDNNNIVIRSDTSNKIAFKCQTSISVSKQYVKSLTLIARTKVNEHTNNQYLSLWNNDTNNWVVFRTQTSCTDNENLIMTITEPGELERYISPSGVIKARLYNSSISAFIRTADMLTFCIEYGEVGTFEFVHISDVHELIGSDNFRAIINEVNTNVNPAFTIITGDETDHGTLAQYDKYLEDVALLNGLVHTGTGNHDVRWWNSNGKNDFKNMIGPLYYSFDYGGVHFVMLDSTVNFELCGKYGKAQMEWLASDLSGITPDTPVIIFAHHPLRIHNNETGKHELIEVIKDYNVVAWMGGHLHEWGYTFENGILWEFIPDQKNNNDQWYATVKITPNKLYIYKSKATGYKSLWLTVPMINKRKANLEITGLLVRGSGDVEVTVRVNEAPDGVSTIKARIDNYGPWTTLVQNGDVWRGTINISDYSPHLPYGRHFVGVNMTDNINKIWKEYKEYNWDGGNVITKWVYQTGDVIQSSPTYFDGTVYIGSEDGKVYAINADDGALEWSYTTEDQIISKPSIYEGENENFVIVGSHDKKLYALNALDGSLEWYYPTEGSVISDPLVDNGTVYFGSGDTYIYALDAQDGSFKWKCKVGGLMKQKPVISGDVLYAFVRDTYIWYAINTADGSLYWRGNAGTDESRFVLGDIMPIMTGNNKLWCIDAQYKKAGYLNPINGNLEWTYAVDKMGSRGPTTDGIRVFYPANEGREVYAINVSDNSHAWHRDLRAGSSDTDLQEWQISSGLAYSEGVLYHAAERGRITGFDSTNGDIVFIYDAVGYPERCLWSTPEVHKNTVYIGGLDGKVYAIKYNR